MKLFLGYPSERLAEARQIWEVLSSLGLEVWFDRENVLPGQDWRRERETAQDSADLIIHLISPEVVVRAGEVQRELKRTLNLAADRPFGDIFLLPIVVGEVLLPPELADKQYVEFSRADWPVRVAKSIARKFEQSAKVPPQNLGDFLASDAREGGRIDLQIRDTTGVRDLQADYFRYRFPGTYFDYVNAEIASKVMGSYYFWRREWTQPVYMHDGELWQSYWSVQVGEFFRREQLISLRVNHQYYSAGAAHGNHGTSGMNFGGEDIGIIEVGHLFDHDGETLKFLLEFTRLGLKQKLLSYGEDVGFLIDFDEHARDQSKGWGLFQSFNFNDHGMTFNFDPYDVLAYAFGSHEIQVGWEHLKDRVADPFKAALAPIFR